MKKVLIFACVALLAAATAEARRKSPGAGYVKDGVFYDVKYDYSFTVNSNWSDRIRKNKENYRIVLVQKNYGIPPHYQNAEVYTLVPRVVVYMAETNMRPGEFVDSLFSRTWESDLRSEIRKEFDFLNEQDIVPKGRNRLEIGKNLADIWEGEAKYAKNVQTSASALGGKRVNSSYGGTIVAVKNGDKMLVFQVMAEKEFYDSVLAEAMGMIKSLKWGEAGATDEAPEPEAGGDDEAES